MTMEANQGRTAVVTGASGLLGRYLCTDLARRGWRVRALARRPDALPDFPAGVQAGHCDLPDTLDESLLEGADVFVHAAYATRAKSVEEARRVNEEGTRRVIEASRRAGIDRFVFISSLVAYPEAPSYYGRGKYKLERLLDMDRDLALRPGLILAREGQGLFQRMRNSMRSTRLVPLFGGGRQPLQTVHVDDVCEALSQCLERRITGVVHVAEIEPVSMSTFLHGMAEGLGLRCLFLPLPFAPMLLVLRAIEALRLPFPLQSENLLGLEAMRRVNVVRDLEKMGLEARTWRQSLDELLEP